jgi:hypothetical protein
MQTHIIIPFSQSKNLGKAYNEEMARIPEGDSAIIMDYDVQLLTPDAPSIISKYANENFNSVLTCFTNRIHPLNKEQLFNGQVNENPNIADHIKIARQQTGKLHNLSPVYNHFSGFLFVLPKSVWKKVPFPELGTCLGVDTEWFKLLKANNIPMLRMNRIYVWHTYRLIEGITNKEHLL